jgi:hypothetical protein
MGSLLYVWVEREGIRRWVSAEDTTTDRLIEDLGSCRGVSIVVIERGEVGDHARARWIGGIRDEKGRSLRDVAWKP